MEGLNSTKGRGDINLLSLVELDHPFSPNIWHQHSWFLGVWTWTDDFDICSLGSPALEFGLKQHLSFPGPLAQRLRLWDFSASIVMSSNTSLQLFFYISICILLSLFLWQRFWCLSCFRESETHSSLQSF